MSRAEHNLLVVPIIIPIAIAIGVAPIIPAVAGVLGTNAGAMLPVSTPPNAIVYRARYVPMKRMIATGVIVDIICNAAPPVFGIGSILGPHL